MTVEETKMFFGVVHADANAPRQYNWRNAPVRYILVEDQQGEGASMLQYRLAGVWAFETATQEVQVALRRVTPE